MSSTSVSTIQSSPLSSSSLVLPSTQSESSFFSSTFMSTTSGSSDITSQPTLIPSNSSPTTAATTETSSSSPTTSISPSSAPSTMSSSSSDITSSSSSIPSSSTQSSSSASSSSQSSSDPSTSPSPSPSPPPPPPPSSSSSSTEVPPPSPSPSPTPSESSSITTESTPISTTSSPSPSSTAQLPPSTSLPDTTVVVPPSTSPISPTDGPGLTLTTAPSIITTVLTSTQNDGQVVTVTETHPNPTLSPNKVGSKGSGFFHNTGAVTAVFVLVGLAAASILLWIIFAVRRRRRTMRLEHDTAVSATLAAAGFNRAPLDDDDDPRDSFRSRFGSPDIAMSQRRSSSGLAIGTSSSAPSGIRTSGYLDNAIPMIEEGEGIGYDPYTDFGGGHEGYMPARTSSPPPPALNQASNRDFPGHETTGEQKISHSASHSAGSYEPLLASYHQQTSGSPGSPTVATPPTPPPRNPRRLELSDPVPPFANVQSGSSSVYSSESTGDDRLDPGLRHRLIDDDTPSNDLRDDEDYSRPVLGVRNLPDVHNRKSEES